MNSSYQAQRAIDSKEAIIVGVNEFLEKESESLEASAVDPLIEKKKIDRLREFKKNRDSEKVKKSLETLKKVAKGSENLFPAVLTAVESEATLGEISHALREVFGEYREVSVL